ncbi:uncharacterized protein LOC134496673 [Candoia aspera]|uniref:uncharacterized protein LOC134496673 n=1 Tax=Candoia aspera TaxID=51853 RepID=UPI002FD7B96F
MDCFLISHLHYLVALAEVLAAITNLLKKYESGLQIKKIQKFLLATHGIDLETFSIAKGYKDILTFLDDQMPNLRIKRQGKSLKCVVQLSEDLTIASVPICSILQLYPNGLKLKKLKEAVKKKCGYDLEVFCSQLGYEDVVSCLQEIPELIIKKSKNVNCIVQLQSDSSTPASSLDSDFSENSASALSQTLVFKKTDLTAALVPVVDVLSGYPCGMTLNTLKENLEKKHGFDLEAFSQKAGYSDAIPCLLTLPGLHLSFWNEQQPHDCVIMLLSSGHAVPHLSHSSEILLHKDLSSSGSNLSQELMETKPSEMFCYGFVLNMIRSLGTFIIQTSNSLIVPYNMPQVLGSLEVFCYLSTLCIN